MPSSQIPTTFLSLSGSGRREDLCQYTFARGCQWIARDRLDLYLERVLGRFLFKMSLSRLAVELVEDGTADVGRIKRQMVIPALNAEEDLDL